MHQPRTLSQKIGLFLKGLTMGAANKVPGVSGGMVSYVLGFYEEMIYSFNKINRYALRLLLLGGRFKSFFRYVNGPFLLWLMGGSLFSYFSVSLLLDFFLKNFELYVWSWFFGMIIGSVIYIARGFNEWSPKTMIFVITGAIIGIAISFLEPAKENDNLWFVFLCGIIGVSGMTLPGLSGSFILILLGNYVLLLVDSVNVLFFVIKGLVTGDLSVLENPENIRYLKIITVFTAGSVFGLISISHLLGYALKKYNRLINALIIGFITGSLGIVWPWKQAVYLQGAQGFLLDQNGNKIIENYQRYVPKLFSMQTWLAIGFIVFGIALILIIDRYGKKRK